MQDKVSNGFHRVGVVISVLVLIASAAISFVAIPKPKNLYRVIDGQIAYEVYAYYAEQAPYRLGAAKIAGRATLSREQPTPLPDSSQAASSRQNDPAAGKTERSKKNSAVPTERVANEAQSWYQNPPSRTVTYLRTERPLKEWIAPLAFFVTGILASILSYVTCRALELAIGALTRKEYDLPFFNRKADKQ